MQRFLLPIVGLVAVVASGCGGGDKVTGDNNGLTAGCTATLTGAVTGTVSCAAGAGVAATWAQSTNLTAIGAVITGSPAITVAIGFPGQPAAGTYLSTSATAAGGLSVSSNQLVWVASGGAGALGTYTLHLTSVSGTSSGNGIVYSMHGTLDSTLPPASGSGGSVTLHMTF